MTPDKERNKKMNTRSICEIACDIVREWKNVSYCAKPYLDAMFSLDSVNDNYGFDSGREIVCRFLCNASQFKGGNSKSLKNELRAMVGLKLAR